MVLHVPTAAARIQRRRTRPADILLLTSVILACRVLSTCRGQGLDVTTGDSLGADNRLFNLAASYKAEQEQATKWGDRWANRHRSLSCSARGTGTLCGSSTASTSSAAALRVACSPVVYDTRNRQDTGGLYLAPLPRDQGDCNLCVACSVSAAAQSAAAAAQCRNTNDVAPLSIRQLHFCAPGSHNDCINGWKLQPALQALAEDKFIDGLLPDQCLPMLGSIEMESLDDKDVCNPVASCTATPPLGTYSYTKTVPLVDIWQIQDHIRKHGASVVTRVTLPPGFKEWFGASPSRRTAVYDNPSASNDIVTTGGIGTNHAVVIAGYNNAESWWLVWSSWGSGWADGGFGKVKYGQLGIGDPSFTYGVTFKPVHPPPDKLEITHSSDIPDNCIWYTVQQADYISKVADLLGIPIESLLQSNTQRLSNLAGWLETGSRLQACDVHPMPKTDWGEYGSKAADFCASPAYRRTTCGWASDAELVGTISGQCPLCGMSYQYVPPKTLPGTIVGTAAHEQFAANTVAMACEGRVIIRAIFKIMKQSSYNLSFIGPEGIQCTSSQLTHVDDVLSGEGGEASAVVRCQLQVPNGPQPEADRVLQAKEYNCYICGSCAEGSSCVSKTGVWYSDTYTTKVTGCDFDPSKGYHPHRAGIMIQPGAEVLLAKFEVCNTPSCYDPAYEDEKLRTAGRCYHGQCRASTP